MTIHPRHPPSPDVAKMTDLGRGNFSCCVEFASDEVAMTNGLQLVLIVACCVGDAGGCLSLSLALYMVEYRFIMIATALERKL